MSSFDSNFSGLPNGGPSRQRPSFSSTRTASSSNTMTSSTVLEQNNTEPYSGATFETVPSSIVSFHHPHSFQSSANNGYGGDSITSNGVERRGRNSTEADSLLLSPTHSQNSHHSQSRSPSHNSNFRFFTDEQIENAEGVSSTLDNVDYDISWDATPSYEQQKLHYNTRSGRSSIRSGTVHSLRSRSSARSGSVKSYGAVQEATSSNNVAQMRSSYSSSPHSSSSSSRYSYRDRIPLEVEVSSEDLSDDNSSHRSGDNNSERGFLEDEDSRSNAENNSVNMKKSSYHTEYLKPEYHDRFYPQHVPHLHFQRFYIAEEDLVVGIAGYKTSKFRMYSYIILCWLSLGMLYLVLRWTPRHKVNFYGIKTSLGKAEWVVVESEFGELSIINVNRKWYNRPLSTLLPSDTADNESVHHHHHHHHESRENPNIPILISFEYRYFTLIYSPLEDIYRTNSNWADPDWLDLYSVQRGLSTSVQEDRMLAFGKNSINLKQKTTSQILFDEALHPFYVFQVFSIILWLLDDYYYYAGCIFLISLISIINTLIETKQTSKRLAELSQFHCEVRVYKDGFWTQVSSSELVPGDIYEVSDPSLSVFPCDSILLSGDCIVNESMLTGESVPVSKFPANEDIIGCLLEDFKRTQISNKLAKSFLFNGTKIIRVRVPKGQPVALAMAVRTGFSTTKGSLVRSMVFPKPSGFKFYEDSFKYIGFMTLVAIFGFSISCVNFIRLGLDHRTMILRALDIITIVVPPALPATLTIGTSFALSRLKERGIFCITPTRVNVGGKIDVMCFDKTGTLTEDGLDVLGVHISQPRGQSGYVFGDLLQNVHNVFNKFSLNDCSSPLDFRARNFLISLITCHSLRLVDGELLGDPLDFKMFQFTRWAYEEDFQDQKFHSLNEERYDDGTLPENLGITPAVVHPCGNDSESCFTENDPHNLLGITRSFEFVAQLRRMSVIVKPFNENVFWSFTKGAPEVISEICNKNTLPSNYDELLHYYTHNGYRVIACAGKTLPKRTWLYSQKVTREEIESNLEFLGFIIFENKLKSSTKDTLETLQSASVRTVMCTGDNVLTAISVGRESGLIQETRVFVPLINENIGPEQNLIVWQDVDDPYSYLDGVTLKPLQGSESYTLAVTGEVFRILFKNDEILPDSYINNVLLNSSIYARMSPDEKHELVEQLQKINYIVGFCGDGANDCGALKAADVGISLSEAEASVAAPFTSRVFEISCVLDVMKEGRASLVTSFSCFQYMSLYSAIQFITITILYSRGSNLGDFQFLYIDLLLIVPIAIFMSWSKPYDKLVKKRPSANLVSAKILVPLVVNMLIVLLFQIIPWFIVQRMAWYIRPIVGTDDAVQSSDNTVLFFVSNFQYILTAVVLSVGPPYREPMSKNVGFILDVILSLAVSIIMMLISPDSKMGNQLQLTNISGGFKFFIILWVIANYYIQLHLPKKFKELFKKKQSSKKYKNILREQQRLHAV